MNKHSFSPYIRHARDSALVAPYNISWRTLYDYELIFVSDGKCRITADNTEYLCKKNHVILIRPGIRHKFECVDNLDFVQPHIHFDISYSELSEKRSVSFTPEEKMNEYELSLIQEDAFSEIPIPVVFTPYDIPQFQKLFFEIIDIFKNKKYNYQLHYKVKMLELIDLILIQFDSGKRLRPDKQTSVAAIKNFIDNNYLSVINLDSLAKQFYFNKYTMLRNFKASYNQNVIEYYHNKRVEHIKDTLENTSIPIKLISDQLNFTDVYSFSRFFKTHVGCSPVLYRKKHMNQ